jgi:hypothetical protein
LDRRNSGFPPRGRGAAAATSVNLYQYYILIIDLRKFTDVDLLDDDDEEDASFEQPEGSFL